MRILCTRVSLLWVVRVGKSRRGKLVHWVERASFEKNPEVVGDFRAGAESRRPSYHEELA